MCDWAQVFVMLKKKTIYQDKSIQNCELFFFFYFLFFFFLLWWWWLLLVWLFFIIFEYIMSNNTGNIE